MLLKQHFLHDDASKIPTSSLLLSAGSYFCPPLCRASCLPKELARRDDKYIRSSVVFRTTESLSGCGNSSDNGSNPEGRTFVFFFSFGHLRPSKERVAEWRMGEKAYSPDAIYSREIPFFCITRRISSFDEEFPKLECRGNLSNGGHYVIGNRRDFLDSQKYFKLKYLFSLLIL